MKQNVYDHPEFYEMYITLRKSRLTYNDFIEQPAIKGMLPDLNGLSILDLGCGFGELSIYCIDQGAKHVIGVDISEKMLSIAEQDPHIQYINGSMEDIQFEENQFDLVVSSLAVHYVKDFDALVSKIFKWIKPQGHFIFSTEHPMNLARKVQSRWVLDEAGNKLHWPVDHYGEEGIREQFWGIDGVIKYHRKLSTIINILIENGLQIEKVSEPEPIPEGLEEMPKLMYERRRPSFIVIKSKNVIA